MGARATTGDRDEGTEDGPLRLCAESRTQEPIERLIRFVLGPDGTIVPDLARKLPGRGVGSAPPGKPCRLQCGTRPRPQPQTAGSPAREDLPGSSSGSWPSGRGRHQHGHQAERWYRVFQGGGANARGQAVSPFTRRDGSPDGTGQARQKIQWLNWCRAGCGGKPRNQLSRQNWIWPWAGRGTCCSASQARQPTNSAGGRRPAVPGAEPVGKGI
jgi:hypothetical protein